MIAKYDKLPIITPNCVFEAQRDGAKFIRLNETQAEAAAKAGKTLYSLQYTHEGKKISCIGVYVKVSDLIKIAL